MDLNQPLTPHLLMNAVTAASGTLTAQMVAALKEDSRHFGSVNDLASYFGLNLDNFEPCAIAFFVKAAEEAFHSEGYTAIPRKRRRA